MKLLKNSVHIERALRRIAYQISEEISDDFVIVGIKKRGYPLAIRIKKHLEDILGKEIPLGSLNISLYQNDLTMIGNEPIIHDFEIPKIGKKEVVIVDDVLITGRTAHAAIDAILDFGRPSKIKFVSLIDVKKRELPLYADYTGWNFNISEDERIVLKLLETDNEEGIYLAKI